MKSFQDMGLPKDLDAALLRMKFTAPTPIQLKAIPPALTGKDILGSAQTGTGKTAAFGIPLVARLLSDNHSAALVMTPTRELASQVREQLHALLASSPHIKTALLIGGETMSKQLRQLHREPRIIVGTPGRINDHLERGTLSLKQTNFLVLDETDRMLDMGFSAQIKSILKHIPTTRQTLLFSATLPTKIVQISQQYLQEPVRISVNPASSAADKVKQQNRHISSGEKYTVLTDELASCQGSVLVFVKTKYGTEKMAKRLSKAGFPADAIHGNLRQSRRDRVIAGFRQMKFRILVATDVATRGLDIPHIEHVINYDLPQCPEDYIHRIGRTARAGATGSALNLITPEDKDKWHAIDKLLNPGKFKAGTAKPARKGKKSTRSPDNTRHSKSRAIKRFSQTKQKSQSPRGKKIAA